MRVVAGVSFLDTIAATLGLDPLTDGLLILDALALGDRRRMLVPERPTVIAQVYDRRAASQAKLALLDAYPADHPVRVVQRRRHERWRRRSRRRWRRSTTRTASTTSCRSTCRPWRSSTNTRSFEGLRAVIAKLRSPDGGCPWDLEQTHETLKRYLLEEAYEALDALDEGEPHRLAEELGDLLMQIVLQAQVAEDDGDVRRSRT